MALTIIILTERARRMGQDLGRGAFYSFLVEGDRMFGAVHYKLYNPLSITDDTMSPSTSMHVTLLRATPDAEALCSVAARSCYSAKSASELIDDPRGGARPALLREIVNAGHHSVIEHATFSFSIEGISRACSHQIVRHRLASYSQQSQRYVRYDAIEPVVPPRIAEDPAAEERFTMAMERLMGTYTALLEMGIPAEDARFVLPNAMPTNIVVTMNARELNHFITLRSCMRSQWEIRAVALEMLDLAREATPLLFERAGPPCARGPCPEGERSCGQPWIDGEPPESSDERRATSDE